MNCLRTMVVAVCACLASGVYTHDHTGIQPQQFMRITHQEERDLELFEGRSGGGGIFEKLDHTVTQRGKYHLKNSIFLKPLVACNDLKKRQDFIKHCFLYDVYLQELYEHFKMIAEYEQQAGIFEHSYSEIEQKSIGDCYFPTQSFSFLNKNSYALDGLHYMNTALLALPTIEHLVLHYLVSEKLSKQLGIECACPHSSGLHSHATATGQALYTAYNIFHIGVHAAGVIALARSLIQQRELILLLQQRIVALYQVLTSIRELMFLITLDHDVYNYCTQELQVDFAGNRDELDALCAVLETCVSGEGIFSWVRSGSILAAHTYVQEHGELVKKIMDDIGLFEAHCSLVQCYSQSQKSENPYTFAEFVSATSPYVCMVDGQHLLLSAQECVPQSVELGGNEPRSLIITGDNMTGKSTTIKIATVALLMAQVAGYVPCKKFVCTPYSEICTSMYRGDDLQQKLSGFGTECAHADIICNRVQEAQGHVFIAIDELFVATNPEKGARELTALLSELIVHPQVSLMVATHYQEVVQKLQEFSSVIAHYQTAATSGSFNFYRI